LAKITIPSGKQTKNYEQITILKGKSTTNVPLSVAMSVEVKSIDAEKTGYHLMAIQQER